MDENEITSTLERASLLKNRWYLIFKQGDDDEHVSMTAYDTTEEDEDDEYIPAGAIILSGLVELMESDFDGLCRQDSPVLPLRQRERRW